MKKISLGLVLIFVLAVGAAVFRTANALPAVDFGGSKAADALATSTVSDSAIDNSADSMPFATCPTELEALNSVYKGKIVSSEQAHRMLSLGSVTLGIEWKPSPAEADIFGDGRLEEYWPLTAIIATSSSPILGEEYVVFQTSENSGHIAQAQLGGAILMKDTSGWRVKSLQKNIDTLGSFGDIPIPSVVRIGKDQAAFRIDESSGGQGYFSGPMYLYSLVGGKFEKILAVGDAYSDNSGAGYDGTRKTYHYDTKLKFISGTNPQFDDIIATTDGTRAADIRDLATVAVHRVVRYSFDGTRYHAIGPRIISSGPYSFIVATTSVEVLWNNQFNEKIVTDPQSTGYEAVQAGIIPESKLVIADMDVNFDGNPDLGVLTGVGYGGVNYFYDFYLSDAKESGDFSETPALRGIGNPSLDAAKKEVISHYRSGPQWYSRKFQLTASGYSDLGEVPETDKR